MLVKDKVMRFIDMLDVSVGAIMFLMRLPFKDDSQIIRQMIQNCNLLQVRKQYLLDTLELFDE